VPKPQKEKRMKTSNLIALGALILTMFGMGAAGTFTVASLMINPGIEEIKTLRKEFNDSQRAMPLTKSVFHAKWISADYQEPVEL